MKAMLSWPNRGDKHTRWYHYALPNPRSVYIRGINRKLKKNTWEKYNSWNKKERHRIRHGYLTVNYFTAVSRVSVVKSGRACPTIFKYGVILARLYYHVPLILLLAQTILWIKYYLMLSLFNNIISL